MKTGRTDELNRYKNLKTNELSYLKGIYLTRLKWINTELAKREKVEDIIDFSIRILKDYIKDPILVEDTKRICNQYIIRCSGKKSGPYTNDQLSAAIASTVLNFYNIEFNPYDIVNKYDIDEQKFYSLYNKVLNWSNQKYWKK